MEALSLLLDAAFFASGARERPLALTWDAKDGAPPALVVVAPLLLLDATFFGSGARERPFILAWDAKDEAPLALALAVAAPLLLLDDVTFFASVAR